MLGLQFQKSEDFGAANFVMDFQMDIIDINNPNILIKKGPNLDLLDKHDKNNIASTIMELWSETNTNHLYFRPNTIKKFLCIGCCIYIILLICMIGVLESNLPLFKTDKIKQIVAIALGLISVIVLAIILFGMLFVMQQRLAIREKWRDRFVNNLCAYIVPLKQYYPNLTFSIIYPMIIHSRRIKTSPAIQKLNDNDDCRQYMNDNINDINNNNNNNNNNQNGLRGDEYISSIWCYLRVSEGSIVTPDNEPIFESTHKNMRKDSDFSRITGITSGYSLQIEDDIINNNTKKNSRSNNNNINNNMNNNNNNNNINNNKKKKKKPSKRGNVQTGKFPILSKKSEYMQLT